MRRHAAVVILGEAITLGREKSKENVFGYDLSASRCSAMKKSEFRLKRLKHRERQLSEIPSVTVVLFPVRDHIPRRRRHGFWLTFGEIHNSVAPLAFSVSLFL